MRFAEVPLTLALPFEGEGTQFADVGMCVGWRVLRVVRVGMLVGV
jgi:hypothetical protein